MNTLRPAVLEGSQALIKSFRALMGESQRIVDPLTTAQRLRRSSPRPLLPKPRMLKVLIEPLYCANDTSPIEGSWRYI